jgi:hypothetical protein
MTTYSTAQVRNLALQHLGVLPSGETPSAADAELAEDAVESVHARLDGLGLLNWPVCAIPSAVYFALSYLAAFELVDAFGVSVEHRTRIEAGAARGEIEIRQQTASGMAGTTRATYF